MPSNSFAPAKTGSSRVFLIDGQARPDHAPTFESCLKAMGIDFSTGDIERIECPDPNQYNQFVEVGEIQGAEDRPSTSLTGRYALDLKSKLLAIAKKRCSVDTHVHFGDCTDPSAFNDFKKALIYVGAKTTNYSTEDLGALGSDEEAKIDETADISAREVFEYLPLSYALRAGDIITNEIVDGIVCDDPSCGDCEDESDGCEIIFFITIAAGGSPSTPADVVYSLDKGATWRADDIDSLGVSSDPSGVACVGIYLVVVSNTDGSIEYAFLSEFDGVTDPAWTSVTTGFVAAKGPNDIWSVGVSAFIVGDGGYVYLTTDPTAGVTVLDAGIATTSNLNAVHALSAEFAVAVGDDGVIVFTDNGTTWALAPNTPIGVGGGNFNTVWVVSELEWWIGGTTADLYYTLNGGVTWTIKAFPGSGAGVIRDIQFPKNGIGYLAHDTVTPVGRILESIDGGFSWIVAPRGKGALPAVDQVNALASCIHDPDFVVGGGLADDGSDGFLLVGSD